jgi:anaerobic magnesium-protoporphyrin IX monomethyl ester cyclase
MARVFLLNPPSPEPVNTPLLSFCHLAASLRAGGHQVALYDASAPRSDRDPDAITARVAAFSPDLVGLHLKTLHVQPAYAMAASLAGRWPLVAGGPHATVCPDEPFRHGFDHVVRGEGEEVLVEFADAVDGRRALGDIFGLSFATRISPSGVRHNAPRPFIRDLDALAPPMSALDLFDPTWYGHAPGKGLPPAGLLSSRGCPAACTFCSNNVTGRKFRYRSPASIVSELLELRKTHGIERTQSFSFFDDSFAVGSRRVREVCAALRGLRPGVHWTCTAHPAHLDPATLAEMKSAGCGGIDIGMESGDPAMLVRIGKGVTVERVLDVLGWCRDLGLHVVVNLMFGWPGESPAELEATIEFMDRAQGLASAWNARGVVVPYPGTEIYDRYHEVCGFTEWWIREPSLAYEPFPTTWAPAEIMRCYASDPALERNFFRLPDSHVERIRFALSKKADVTFAAISAQIPRMAAAGAR